MIITKVPKNIILIIVGFWDDFSEKIIITDARKHFHDGFKDLLVDSDSKQVYS